MSKKSNLPNNIDDYTKLVKQILEKRLEDIRNGKSFFGKIPNEIGDLVYCNTTNYKEIPDSKKKKIIKATLTVVIPLVVAGLCFLASFVFGIVMSIIALIAVPIILNKIFQFKGTDMFVGTEGYATYSFEHDRKNIIEEKIHRFDEFSDLIATGTELRNNAWGLLFGLIIIYKGTYGGTEYSYTFYKNDGKQLIPIDSFNGEYHYENADDNFWYFDENYMFWSCIEEMWSKFKLEEYKQHVNQGNDTISFAVVKDNTCYPNCIRLTESKIYVGEIEYNSETMKGIDFSNGNLIIEHINHTSKLFGLIQKGNQEVIPLNSISNRAVFLKLLSCLIKIE